ncbi:MAG TPA: hypothetical protein VEH31_19715 [Streptosporangiaceae bacterium]|nr:hypothetical protein [Streptosporangiaceae bacterium]HYA53602.1 hypothetical protein [Streptosporangiaceae bacterium]
MRGKGINYDTGFSPGGRNSREHFDAGIVRGEMRVIAGELGCTAVRVSGGDPGRLSVAGEAAAAEGLEVWFAPFPCELAADQLAPLFADCADRAEHLRRGGADVVLVTGCELTLFGAGFLPGGTVYERIAGVQSGGPQLHAAYAALPGKLNGAPGPGPGQLRRGEDAARRARHRVPGARLGAQARVRRAGRGCRAGAVPLRSADPCQTGSDR